jgi:hypothetical protein
MSTSSQPPHCGALVAVVDVLAGRGDDVEVEVVAVVPQQRGADVDALVAAAGGLDALLDLGVDVAAALGHRLLRVDEEHVELLLQLGEQPGGVDVRLAGVGLAAVLPSDGLLRLVAEDLLDLGAADLRVEALVAEEEEVALLAAVGAREPGVAGVVVGGELVRLLAGAAAALLEPDLAQDVVEAVVGLELADLQRSAVAGGRVADRGEADRGARHVILELDLADEHRQLGVDDARVVAARARDVHRHDDRGEVHALALGAVRVQLRVHAALRGRARSADVTLVGEHVPVRRTDRCRCLGVVTPAAHTLPSRPRR